jgi:hypothetical protein
MSDFQTIGNQFVQHYYTTIDSNRANLASLYSNESMLSFEGEQFLGTESIMGKLAGLPSLQHAATTFDFQPTVNNGIIAFVTGQIAIDGGNPMMFVQIFHLAVGGAAGYYVYNDIFRLNLA